MSAAVEIIGDELLVVSAVGVEVGVRVGVGVGVGVNWLYLTSSCKISYAFLIR